jgi:thiol peroxidase
MDLMIERTGEAFELDERLTIVGRKLQPGDRAPDFELAHLDPATEAVRTVSLTGSDAGVWLLNVVNSLDTPVCGVETRRWEELRRGLPDDVRVCTISMDLPFAQARWCGAEDVRHEALSAHASEAFGRGYGVLLKEWRLLQRAVFVIGADGIVTHAEYVRDQMREPDYEAAITAAATSSDTTDAAWAPRRATT